jgi:hypothetical protein
MSDNSSLLIKPERPSLFAPVALIALVLVGMLGSDIYHGYRQHHALGDQVLAIKKSVTDARKVRDQFDALVRGVAELAGNGNDNAAAIVASLEKAGVKFKSSP